MHTPGPWTAQRAPKYQHAIDRKWEIVAKHPNAGGETVIVGEHTGIDCLKESNARLIAAAPDLLAALEIAQCACTVRERDSGHRSGCWKPEADAAIAKAKGK